MHADDESDEESPPKRRKETPHDPREPDEGSWCNVDESNIFKRRTRSGAKRRVHDTQPRTQVISLMPTHTPVPV